MTIKRKKDGSILCITKVVRIKDIVLEVAYSEKDGHHVRFMKAGRRHPEMTGYENNLPEAMAAMYAAMTYYQEMYNLV